MRPFTPRERQVLGCVARGMTDKEIATELGLAAGTAKVYVARIRAKDPAHRNRYALIKTKLWDDMAVWLEKWGARVPSECLADLETVMSGTAATHT